MYLIAAAAAALILGLVFGVPRSREGLETGASERYASNSNLEQISDWLTKLLVGVGLVQLSSLPESARLLGAYLGADMDTPNAEALSVSIVAYGLGVGFLSGYLWARLRLRVFLEAADRLAAETSKTQVVAEQLRIQNADNAQPESGRELGLAAASAVAARESIGGGSIASILWVDDVPDNNSSILDAFRGLDIYVELALSTAQGVDAFKRRSWGLIITDLGRKEPTQHDPDHYNPDAGVDLIKQVRRIDKETPIFVFGTNRAVALRGELEAAGASLVTNRASMLFERAVRAVTMTAP